MMFSLHIMPLSSLYMEILLVVLIETQEKTNINSPSFSSDIFFVIFTAEGRYNIHTADGKYIFKERESFDGRNILKVSMKESELEIH